MPAGRSGADYPVGHGPCPSRICWTARRRGCRWGIYCKETLQLIGTCGYHCLREEECFCAEIGYDLAKQYWGQGIMQEVLEVVIQYGFHNMGLKKIEATVGPENHRSIKLLERMNFVRDDQMHGNLIYFFKKIIQVE